MLNLKNESSIPLCPSKFIFQYYSHVTSETGSAGRTFRKREIPGCVPSLLKYKSVKIHYAANKFQLPRKAKNVYLFFCFVSVAS